MALKQRLAIVGASVRAAAQSALRAGFDVVGADLFADADLDGVCPITKISGEEYPEALEGWLAEQDVDAWMYTGALENHPDLVDRMSEIAPLWGVSGQPLRRCRDPMVLQEVFRAAEVAFPETKTAQDSFTEPRPSGSDPRDRNADWSLPNRRGSEPSGYLAKSYRHSAGAGVFALDDQDAWRRATEGGFFAQRRLLGESISAAFVVGHLTAVLLGVTTQLTDTAVAPWSYRGSVVRTNNDIHLSLVGLGIALKDELGLAGLVGVDLVLGEQGLSVLEINPRWTASIEVLESSALRNATISHAAACIGEGGGGWRANYHHVGAKWVVFADDELVVDETFTGWAKAQGHADIPRPGTRIAAGQPICTVFAESGDEQATRAMLMRRATETLLRLRQSR